MGFYFLTISNMTNIKNFSDFVNLYEISRTLRFELKAIWDTEKLLEENQIFLTDKIRKKKYEKVKPFLNLFHLDFITFCLSGLNLDYSNYEKVLFEYKKDTKNFDNEKLKKYEEKKLREQIVNKFNIKVEDYLQIFWEVTRENGKIKVNLWDIWATEFNKLSYEFLFEIWIFNLMKKKFEWDWNIYITDEKTWEILKNEKTWKDLTIFDDWNGWLWYFTKFFETRKNFYKSDGTSTALATRIIDQNLKRFCDNLDDFKKVKDKVNFGTLETDFLISLNEFFSLSNYNSYVLQEWIEKYNDIIWWKVIENNKKLPWVNEYINKYRQDTWEKLPYLQALDKQILSGKKIFIKQIENEVDFKDILEEFYKNSVKNVEVLSYIFSNLWNYNDEDYKTIYFSKEAFNTITHKFSDKVLLFEKLVFGELLNDKLVEREDFDKKEEKYKFPDFIPLYCIKKWLENYNEEDLFYKTRYYKNENWFLEENNLDLWKKFYDILYYEFKTLLSNKIINQNGEEIEIWFYQAKNSLENIFDNFSLTEKNKVIIKDFVDVSRTIYQMWKYFALEKKRGWDNKYDLNDDFYKTQNSPENKAYWYLEFYNEAYEKIITPYNLMRNYIAKKPWEDNKKWKLNFESSSLLSWWDKDFESYWAYIFEKNWLYYLWIINWTKFSKSEVEKLYVYSEQNKAKRFVYDFQKPDNKNTPRLFIRSKWDNFAPAVEDLKLPINDIIDIYDSELYKVDKKNPTKHKESLRKLIDYFKLWFTKHQSYKHFNFIWKNSNEYENIADFYRDVEKSCYKPYWENVNFEELVNLTKEKRIYLFQIYNQDFKLDESIIKENYTFTWKWKGNIHTLYFKWLFQKENLENKNWVNIKLSWWGEVFFRPKTDIEKLWEKLYNPITKKWITKTEAKNLWQNYESWKKVANHKRYENNKIFLHFPIQLNFKENKALNFNNLINNFLANNPDINIIWIDRWEKHLAYYSVINQKQEILESGSLNYIYQKDTNWNFIKKPERKIEKIIDNSWKIIDYKLSETWEMLDYEDYKILLDYKEKKRKLQRQSWGEVEQIKDSKKWYISVVIRKIADLIIKYNAIVILEDLNVRFKQIRWGIEKSIYQQLEKALIDKLNFLVEKWETDINKAWNLLKAYQLTAPFTAFKEMWKQTWIIFYTQASYTSKIDPVTGWRPNLYIKKWNAKLNKENILKFESIVWNREKNRFEITYDLKDFQNKKSDEFPNKTKWTLCTCVERYKWDKNLNNNKWWYELHKNLTDDFKELFWDYEIDIFSNIKEQIKNLEEEWNEKFFNRFLDLFKLLCQIRNTNDSAKEEWKDDFILSPIEPFFDSRESEKFWKNLPKNWDDNGAYNIARKWIIILNEIWKWQKENEKLEWKKEKSYPDFFISHKYWDDFVNMR